MKPTTATRSLAVTLLGLAIAASAADTTLIYKTIDADGTTVFTDQPAPEAVLVTPPPLNVVDQAPSTAATPNQTSLLSAPPAVRVDNVSIVSPAHEQTFIDPQATLWVEFELSPAETLPVGLSAQVLLDDKVLSTGSANRLPIDIPERGTHRVLIRLIDPTGTVQLESEAIDIHVRHHVAGSSI